MPRAALRPLPSRRRPIPRRRCSVATATSSRKTSDRSRVVSGTTYAMCPPTPPEPSSTATARKSDRASSRSIYASDRATSASSKTRAIRSIVERATSKSAMPSWRMSILGAAAIFAAHFPMSSGARAAIQSDVIQNHRQSRAVGARSCELRARAGQTMPRGRVGGARPGPASRPRVRR